MFGINILHGHTHTGNHPTVYRKHFELKPKPLVGKDVLAQVATNQPVLQRTEQQFILKNYSLSTRKT